MVFDISSTDSSYYYDESRRIAAEADKRAARLRASSENAKQAFVGASKNDTSDETPKRNKLRSALKASASFLPHKPLKWVKYDPGAW